MKNILVITTLFLATLQVAFAQNIPASSTEEPLIFKGDTKNKTGKNYLKLYVGFDLAQHPVLEPSSLDESTVIYKQEYATRPFFALAFARELNRGDFWEISGQTNAYAGRQDVYEFSNPRIDTIPFPPLEMLGTERNHLARLQYEYNWLLSGDNTRMVRTYMGLFVRSQAQWARFEPATSVNFPREAWSAVLMPGFVPRLLLKGSRRLQIDLSAPITLGYFGMNGSVYRDPQFTKRQQRSASFDMSIFNLETQIRLGVAYSLNRPAE
jgi:hypothetical protein